MRSSLLLRCVVLLLVPVGLAGCKSAMVDATVRNETSGAIRLIEVQYPSASFGVQGLASGAEYHYRFKILGNGKMALLYTDAEGKEHTVKGPEVREGEHGGFHIIIGSAGVQWQPALTP